MGDPGSYPALRLLLLLLSTIAIAIPLGRALPASDQSSPVPPPSLASQDFYLTPVPEFLFQTSSTPTPSLPSSISVQSLQSNQVPLLPNSHFLQSTASHIPVPVNSPTHKSFFSRVMIPFERLLRSCFLEDVPSVGDCLKEKVVLALRRASVMESVPLGGQVALVKDDRLSGETAAEEDIENSLEDVDTRLFKGVADFLRGRALRVSLPENIFPMVQQSLEEARGKKHKLGYLVTCVALILKTLAIASIAFLAKKALLVGKLALILSAALMVKKLMGGGGGGGGSGTSYEVVSLHRRSHQRDLPRHGEVYPSYVAGEAGMDTEGEVGGDSLAYGGYAIVRRGKEVRGEWKDFGEKEEWRAKDRGISVKEFKLDN